MAVIAREPLLGAEPKGMFSSWLYHLGSGLYHLGSGLYHLGAGLSFGDLLGSPGRSWGRLGSFLCPRLGHYLYNVVYVL